MRSLPPPRGVHTRLNARVDLATGTEKFGGPEAIHASVSGSGYNSQNGTITLGPASTETQRTSLLLSQGAVYAGFGNCGPDNDPWHGWVLGYKASNLSRKFVFNSTPMAGRAVSGSPAAVSLPTGSVTSTSIPETLPGTTRISQIRLPAPVPAMPRWTITRCGSCN